MLVKVTQKHIDNGVPCDPKCCPLALAITDGVENMRAMVQHSLLQAYAKIYTPGKLTVYRLPDSVHDKLIRYDRNHVMEPFEFEFDLENGESRPWDTDYILSQGHPDFSKQFAGDFETPESS